MKRRQLGVTIIELIIFIVIVSIAVVGILQLMNVTSRYSGDPQMRKQALSIAEGLLEEVELARFTYCDPADANAATAASPAGCATTQEAQGPEAGNARPFDNVNDYVTTFGPTFQTFNNGGATLRDATGNAIVVTGTYNAFVTIVPDAGLGPAASPIPSAAAPANMNVLRITVTVRYNSDNEFVTLDGYRTRYAPNSIP